MAATWTGEPRPTEPASTAVVRRLDDEVLGMLASASPITLERAIHQVVQQHHIDAAGRCRVCAECRPTRWRWWRYRRRDTPAPCPTRRLLWVALWEDLSRQGGA